MNNYYNECTVHMCIWYNCFSSKVDNHLKWRIACLIYSGMQTYCSSNYINLILCFYIFLVVQQMNARANYKILKWMHSMSWLTSLQCNLRFNLAAKWSIIYMIYVLSQKFNASFRYFQWFMVLENIRILVYRYLVWRYLRKDLFLI